MIQNGDMLVPAYPGCPGKWLLNKCRHISTPHVTSPCSLAIGLHRCPPREESVNGYESTIHGLSLATLTSLDVARPHFCIFDETPAFASLEAVEQ